MREIDKMHIWENRGAYIELRSVRLLVTVVQVLVG